MTGDASSRVLEGFFRRGWGRVVAALTRSLGTQHLALAEDVAQEALLAALEAWRFGVPRDPEAWLIQTARNRAIDRLRRERRLVALAPAFESETVASALAPEEDAINQLWMMFSICDEGLSHETHVSLILRLLCGLSPAEIAAAFLVDTQTIDRRLHRGRARLRSHGQLPALPAGEKLARRRPSVLHALYLLFNEGYQGSDAANPLHPAMCAEALRLVELMLEAPLTRHPEAHALAALFCFSAARLPTRLDGEGIFVPLAEQDRRAWDSSLIERGVVHLSDSASGTTLSRWHLEAGIACEHAIAPSVEETRWARIVELYEALYALAPGPIVALNRGLAIAELHGLDAGRRALLEIAARQQLVDYHFFWGALADLERRAGRTPEALGLYERAIALSRNEAERLAYERRRALLAN